MNKPTLLAILIISLCFACKSARTNETIPQTGEQNCAAATDSISLAYKPTEEVYNRTFDEVDSLINELNDIIRNRDYINWLDCLSDDYKTSKNDPLFLSELSNQPTLVTQKIVLKSMKDYFEYVIVPSRLQSKLDKIVFVSEDRVKALSTLYGKSVILYNLVKVNGKWKIGNSK
jgi:hypothetical protein